MTRFNIEATTWETALDEIYESLERLARRGGTTHYSDLVREISALPLQPDSAAFHAMLGDVSRRAFDAGAPLLSVLVLLKGAERPGSGFFDLARELGFEVGQDEDSEATFFGDQLQQVHTWWRRR